MDDIARLVIDPLLGNLDAVDVVPYNGPLPDSEEYKAEVAKFESL